MISDWIRNSVEWHHFGWNLPTLTFSATLFFTCLQCLTLSRQARKIEGERSGESVSVPLFSYMAVVYITFGYYGVINHSVGSVFNGSVGVFFLRVLGKLRRFKGFTRREKGLMATFAFAGVLVLVLPWKTAMMTGLMGGAALPLVQQALEIRRNQSVGALDIRFIVIFTGSLTFWTGYAFLTHHVPLMIVNPPMFFVLATFYYYWYKYRSKSEVVEAR